MQNADVQIKKAVDRIENYLLSNTYNTVRVFLFYLSYGKIKRYNKTKTKNKQENVHMKNILMIGTGGTIASKQTEYGLAPGLSAEDILNYIPAVSKICEVDSLQVCNLDSTNVTPEHWKLLAKTVQENYDRYDGFVICHGTDTLAYTAAALSYMIQNSRKPIVITGAQSRSRWT